MDLKSYLCLFVVLLAAQHSFACCPRSELERLRGPLTRRLLAGPCVDIKTVIKQAIEESCISKEYESKIMETVLSFKCKTPQCYNQMPQYYQQHILPIMPMPVNPHCHHNYVPGCQSPCQTTTTTTTTPKPTTTSTTTTICPPTAKPPKPCDAGYPCQCGCGSMGPCCNYNQQQENMYEKILMLFSGKQPQYSAPYPQYPNCQCHPNQCHCRPGQNCGC